MVVTTQERDHQIKADPTLREAIEGLKGLWLIGLHHNWHDWKFSYDPLFDFSMAGDGDLVEVNGKDVPRIPMDACNFVPRAFHPGTAEKFWDIIYVARAVNFKRIPEFFNSVRKLYDRGHKYRVLFICPVPPYDPKEEQTVFYKIRESYDKMFSEPEKDLFNLLTITYRYPFPFDLQTLALFYRSSKVFVHTADDERRCRVAAYAWASGLPVVGMDCVGGLLPPEVRRPPYFFEPKRYADFPDQIVKAISSLPAHEWDPALMRATFSEACTPETLDKWLLQMAGRQGLSYQPGHISCANLSIRLGRHHNGVAGPNSLKATLLDLVQWLGGCGNKLPPLLESPDPESMIQSSMAPGGVASLLGRFFSRT
jgi:glycosyltransferase involved in cell wall biosynthesis